MIDLGMDHALYAKLLKRKGDLPEVKENLNKAIEIYKDCRADGWLKMAEEVLAKIKQEGTEGMNVNPVSGAGNAVVYQATVIQRLLRSQ